MNEIKRIQEVKKIINSDFKGLNIAKFGYCEISNDFITASYFSNSIESCIEVTRNKPHFKEEHKKLNLFHSYMLELKELGGLDF